MNANFANQLENLPDYLGAHVKITLIALAAGIAISLPVAIGLAKWKPARWPTLAAAGIIQTIPSLALLALMVPLLNAFGFYPAVIALTLYSILPVLRNTVTGITGVDPAMTEAARGIGMTPWQVLTKVELPLATPVIIAGVRTATVWVVGIATLSTPVGQTSLGNYIFSGLQTRNWTAVLFGCVAAAILALILDGLVALLESAAEKRSRARGTLAMAGLLLVVGGGVAAPYAKAWVTTTSLATADVTPEQEAEPLGTVRVGSKTFTEQYILADLLAQRLEEAGFSVERAESLGSTIGFDALRHGQIDVFVDYTGTIWANYMEREEARPGWFVLDAVAGWLAETYGIRSLGSLGFENAYALAMRRDRAEQLGIASIEDLVEHAPDLKIGSDYEFFNRPEWFKLRDTYGLNFGQTVSFDSTFMYQAVADGEVDVITAFSSDGRIEAFDLVVLDDPRHAFPPYDAVLLLSPRVANRDQVVDALRPLLGTIDVRLMRRANLWVDGDESLTPGAAAERLAERIDTTTD